MKKITIVPIAVAFLLGVSACSGTAQAQTADGEESYDFDMSVTTSETSTWYRGAEKFAEIVDEQSDGRITISVFANDTLSAGDAVAGVEQLMNGDKALSYNSAIQMSGIDDRFSAIAAPFTFSNYDEVDSVLESAEAQDAYAGLTEEYGVKMLGFGENGMRQISNNTQEIDGPEDLDGLKIRVAGSKLFMDMYQTFGADPLVMSFSELFTSLQTGTVDGQENAVDLLYSNGLAEVQEYLTIMNYVYDPLLLMMNQEMFDELSESDQQLMLDAAAEANAYQIKLIRDTEKEQLVDIKEQMQVKELSGEEIAEFRKALEPVYEEWIPVWTPELYEAIQPK
ncbi:MAG: DctP family TRAP transporter solute-binding subunit [Leucobacter sp.]